jgi:hypothetical protein
MKIKGNCKNCNKYFERYVSPSDIKKGGGIYCSRYCARNHRKNNQLKENINLFYSGKLNDEQSRRLFREIADKVCSICNLSEWMGKPIPLVVDHIDGNHKNNNPYNFRFVCCNCDAQLDTYKSKNRGHGRKYRKIKIP